MNTSIKALLTKNVIVLLSFISITSASLVKASDNNDPDTLVRTTSQDILQIIRSDPTGDNQKIREQVEARVMPLADFPKMTAFAVGRPWRSATLEQKNLLTKEFRLLLARTYLSALTVYKSATLTFKPARYNDKADSATVRVDVTTKGNNKSIPLDFSLEKTNNGWKVFDVAVEGISFMTNHRNQFAPIIASQGLDGLIKLLNDRNNNVSNGSSK